MSNYDWDRKLPSAETDPEKLRRQVMRFEHWGRSARMHLADGLASRDWAALHRLAVLALQELQVALGEQDPPSYGRRR